MKKLIFSVFSVIFIVMVAVTFNVPQPIADVNADYTVDGGRLTIDFEHPSQTNHFSLYTEFDKLPFIMDGKLYAWTLAEQKIILRAYTYTDVEVNVDLTTINECGKIDAGIYVQASNANSQLDGITAWCVNVEHGATSKTFNFKLHRFENGKWLGAFIELMGIPYYSDNVHLRVVVKSGMLYAFLNSSKTPAFEYYIGESEGQVGLRSFYAPNIYDNFSVVGNAHKVNRTNLDNLVSIALEKLNNSKDICFATELATAVENAKNALTQVQVDSAEKALMDILEKAISKRTLSELYSLIEQSASILNPNGSVYTANSYSSFVAVRNICIGLNENSSEYDISYWYDRLLAKINGLIAYKRGE